MLQKAAKGLSYLFIAKIFTKFLDFSLNHLIIRNIDKKIFGLTLYFNLLQNTALLWVKLCLKQSYLKRNVKLQAQDKASQEELDQVLVTSAKNMMTIGSYITIAWSAILFLVWNYLYGDLNENFSQATALVCLGAIFESIQDILIVKALLNFEYGLVATAESIAISTKTILLFLTIYFNVLPPLVCFGFSNAVYGTTLTLASYILNKKNSIGNIKDALTLKKLDNKGIKKAEGAYIHQDMKNTTKEMTLIAFPKFLLQEIEKIILGNINTNEIVNGEYMVISNLGSMIPRYFFAPTEEVCYNLFAKMGQEAKSSDKKEIKISENELSTLRNIFKIINIVGSLVAVFGFSYSSTVLNLLYPNNWDTQSCILGFQLYAVYIYVMGINGVLESFFYSTVNEIYLKRYRYFIVFNTLIFIIASYLLGKYGVWGIVTANIISMVVRILNCFYYMRMKMKNVVSLTQFLKSSLPSKVYIAYLVFVLVFTRFSHGILPKLLFRLAEGAGIVVTFFHYLTILQVLGLGSLAIIYKFHKQEIKSILQKRKEKAQ